MSILRTCSARHLANTSYPRHLKPFDGLIQVVIGRDNRETSLSLQEAITKGLIESGVEVIDLV